MCYTSMMPAELCGLTVDMIDFEKQQIVGAGRKTATRTELPILFGKSLEPVIKALCENAGEDGRLLDVGECAFRERVKKCLARNGCSDLGLYNCRHTTETLLKLNHVEEFHQYIIMRHKQRNITDNYAHAEQLFPLVLKDLDALTHKPTDEDYAKFGQQRKSGESNV